MASYEKKRMAKKYVKIPAVWHTRIKKEPKSILKSLFERSLKNEFVKSNEELVIANYLFTNKFNYDLFSLQWNFPSNLKQALRDTNNVFINYFVYRLIDLNRRRIYFEQQSYLWSSKKRNIRYKY